MDISPGSIITQKQLFGDWSRFAVYCVLDRFGGTSWMIADADVPDELGLPTIIRQGNSYNEVMKDFWHLLDWSPEMAFAYDNACYAYGDYDALMNPVAKALFRHGMVSRRYFDFLMRNSDKFFEDGYGWPEDTSVPMKYWTYWEERVRMGKEMADAAENFPVYNSPYHTDGY